MLNATSPEVHPRTSVAPNAPGVHARLAFVFLPAKSKVFNFFSTLLPSLHPISPSPSSMVLPLSIGTIESDEDVSHTSSDSELEQSSDTLAPHAAAGSDPKPPARPDSLFELLANPEPAPAESSWDFKSAIKQIQGLQHSSQRLTTTLDDKIRRTVEKRRASAAKEQEDGDASDGDEDDDDDEENDADDATTPLEQDDLTKRIAVVPSKQSALAATAAAAAAAPIDLSFSELQLSRPLLKSLRALGFTAPTPIQAQAIPMALRGKDILGSAVTGSGKTAAYLLPVLERLLFRDPRAAPATRVLIIVPTRELAQQVASMLEKLGQFTVVTMAVIVGGLSLAAQVLFFPF